MMHKLLLPALLVFTLMAPATAPASDRSGTPTTSKSTSSKNPWIHIEVLEAGQKEATVKVNLPLKLARTALEMAPDDVMDEGHIRIERTDLTVSDLRKLWKDVREAGDAEFVTVQKKDSTVNISRKGSKLFINVDERDSKEQVRVEVPVSLVDALLTGSGDTLNVDAAVAELEKMGPGEVVHVVDGHDSVRIWIE
jgi:predicted component of type VI protein secretion system